jgi:hypothetical protein
MMRCTVLGMKPSWPISVTVSAFSWRIDRNYEKLRSEEQDVYD